MGLDPLAIPSFKTALKKSPSAVFDYIDVLYKGFQSDWGRGFYVDWERIFIENEDQALLNQFHRKYRSVPHTVSHET